MENRVRMRPLPAGPFREGWEVRWTGKVLDIDFADQSATADLPAGIPVEVQSEERLYLGVLQERHMTRVSIEVEHYLERSQIESIREVWG